MTPITPIKAPALADLKNALQLAVIYGDKDVADSDAKTALERIRGLIACALAKLSEPNAPALSVARKVFPSSYSARNVRDYTAAILYAAVTYGSGPSFLDSLPCPVCHGDGQMGTHRDGQPVVCDSCTGTGYAR